MKSIRLLDRRVGYSLASIGLLLSMAAPAAVPAFASAAVLSDRSIEMSSSAKLATGTSYTVKFTGTANIGATSTQEGGIIIDFCTESPLIGETCTAPVGMDTGNVTVGGVKYGVTAAASGTVTGTGGHIKWVAADPYAGAGATFEMTLGGITNPSDAGVFYARITTYTNKTALDGYVDAETVGSYGDEGSFALNVTEGIGVTGYVLETMTFCVSGSGESGDEDAPGPNCGTGLLPPSLTLGNDSGAGKALNAGLLSEGKVYAQLSTNASGGAIVNLKSNATGCGGLFRNGNKSNCNIAAQNDDQNNATVSAGIAKFGLTVGSALPVTGAQNPTGNLVPLGSYNGSNYFIDYTAGDTEGVTSTSGSPLFSTNGGPVNNKYVPVTFGASIDNSTPAGTYGATFNMTATGTF